MKAGLSAVVNVTSIVGSRVHTFANAIAPGDIKTDILSPETEARLAPTIRMQRIGTPAEVAQVIFFLCSDAASYVTGEEIQINGGQHL